MTQMISMTVLLALCLVALRRCMFGRPEWRGLWLAVLVLATVVATLVYQ